MGILWETVLQPGEHIKQKKNSNSGSSSNKQQQQQQEEEEASELRETILQMLASSIV